MDGTGGIGAADGTAAAATAGAARPAATFPQGATAPSTAGDALRLPSKATFDEAAAIAETLPAAVGAAGPALTVDASALQEYDSSTLSLLMQARRLAQAAGRGFEVVGAPPQLLQLAALYGVDELLGARG